MKLKTKICISGLLLGLLMPPGIISNISHDSVEVKAIATADEITISDISSYLSEKNEHYPISDDFIKSYQQTSGGYIDYARQTGHVVDKSIAEPNQKWHFFDSWLYRSIEDGSLTWDESAKSRVYTRLLCPELLLWIYEACGVDSALVQQAKDVAVEGKENGTSTSTIAKNMRAVVSWEDVKRDLEQNLSNDPTPHYVTCSTSTDYTVSDFDSNGYSRNTKVSFTVTVHDDTKEIASVSSPNVSIANPNAGNYEFYMPGNDVAIQITLKDKDLSDIYPVAVDLNFPLPDQTSVNGYNSLFTCSDNGYNFTISGANNNRNQWNLIKIGQKAVDSVGSIVNTDPIIEKINSIVMTLSGYKASCVTSATLFIADNAQFTGASQIDLTTIIPATSKPGDVVINIPSEMQGYNLYYKIEFNTTSGGSNGFIIIDRIKYLTEALNTLESLSVVGDIPSYTTGSPFTFNNEIKAHYSIVGDVTVTENLSYTLNYESIQIGDLIPSSMGGNNIPLIISYTDNKGVTASSNTIRLNIGYKGTESIVLDKDEVTLGVGGTTRINAEISDEFANDNVIWTSSNPDVASINNGLVTALQAGSTVITATSGDKSATCIVTVTDGELLSILDSNNVDVTGSTISLFNGAPTFTLKAQVQNIDNPIYEWSSSNTSVATFSYGANIAYISIVGAGTAVISVTAGSLTSSVTIVVEDSAMTNLTLTSSVENGTIYNKGFNNELVLTPSFSLIGFATDTINWSSDSDAVTLSATQTSQGNPITVTGVKEGTAVITARSNYSPSTAVNYTVTVLSDGVTQLKWTGKSAFECYAETTLGEATDTTKWVFTATWESGKSENPTVGTGENDVHVGIYETSTPLEEGTPISLDYAFKNSDNNKYLVAFYKGKKASSSMQLSIINWRHVYESEENGELTYDFSTITKGSTTEIKASVLDDYKSTTSMTPASTEVRKLYVDFTNNVPSLKLGSSNASAKWSMMFSDSTLISEVRITAKAYNAKENELVVNGTTLTLGSDFTTFVLNNENGNFTATNSLVIETSTSKKRANISSVVIIGGGTTDIGKSADCLAIEEFINTKLHWRDYAIDHTEGDSNGEGLCVIYYDTNGNSGAKYAFNQLTDRQRELFTTNSAYQAEYLRLMNWATANGDTLDNGNQLVTNNISYFWNIKNIDNNNLIIVITCLSMLSISIYAISKSKRKENNK